MPKAVFDLVRQDLEARIVDGTYPYGSLLPSESMLVSTYGYSRNTIRRALSVLADEGYVQPMNGRGVRVLWQPVAGRAQGTMVGLESFEEYARHNGFFPSTKVKVFEHVTCDQTIAARTGHLVGDDLIHVVRVRYFDDTPRQIDHNYFLASAIPGLTPEICASSVYGYVEQELGMRIVTSKRSMTVELADEEDRTIMDMGSYNCVAVLRSQSFNSEGVMFEHTRTHSHPDAFCFMDTARRA
jgi:GntR family trehalose operon transcriptional repressor